jgi:hypothetical protein
VEERQGVIIETYPKLFTMFVESQNSTVSFSYVELLTHEVELEILPRTRNRLSVLEGMRVRVKPGLSLGFLCFRNPERVFCAFL